MSQNATEPHDARRAADSACFEWNDHSGGPVIVDVRLYFQHKRLSMGPAICFLFEETNDQTKELQFCEFTQLLGGNDEVLERARSLGLYPINYKIDTQAEFECADNAVTTARALLEHYREKKVSEFIPRLDPLISTEKEKDLLVEDLEQLLKCVTVASKLKIRYKLNWVD